LLLAYVAVAFLVAALVYALRFPNGRFFPTRRSKLLRKTGPFADGTLADARIRFISEAGGAWRVLLTAIYAYSVRGEDYELSLPTDSTHLPGPGIREAVTSRENERQMPERLILEDGTRLEGRETIRQHYLERLRTRSPQVKVLYQPKRPAVSTVRDWR
jgi:hypothetical protein